VAELRFIVRLAYILSVVIAATHPSRIKKLPKCLDAAKLPVVVLLNSWGQAISTVGISHADGLGHWRAEVWQFLYPIASSIFRWQILAPCPVLSVRVSELLSQDWATC
jgi:hypothetical protein